MKKQFRLLIGEQKGLTLIELLVTLIVGAILIVGVSATYIQIVRVTAKSNNHMLALRQIQTAGHWVSLDTQMADDAAFVAEPWSLTLNWQEMTGIERRSVYQIGENGTMQREHYIDDVLQGTFLVAEHLVAAETVYDLSFANGVEFRVMAAVNNVTETRAFRIVSRLD